MAFRKKQTWNEQQGRGSTATPRTCRQVVLALAVAWLLAMTVVGLNSYRHHSWSWGGKLPVSLMAFEEKVITQLTRAADDDDALPAAAARAGGQVSAAEPQRGKEKKESLQLQQAQAQGEQQQQQQQQQQVEQYSSEEKEELARADSLEKSQRVYDDNNARVQQARGEGGGGVLAGGVTLPRARPGPLDYPKPTVFFDISIDGAPVGRIIFQLFTRQSPLAAENFRGLCTGEKGSVPDVPGREGRGMPLHFKGHHFYRVIDQFICQTGVGTESIYGGAFEDDPGGLRLKHTKKGLLSMANAGHDTNTSHFSILMAPAPHLDGNYVIFGEVVSGIDVVDKINALAKPGGVPDENPRLPVVIVDSGELDCPAQKDWARCQLLSA